MRHNILLLLNDCRSCQLEVETVLEELNCEKTHQNEDHLGLYKKKCRAFYNICALHLRFKEKSKCDFQVLVLLCTYWSDFVSRD